MYVWIIDFCLSVFFLYMLFFLFDAMKAMIRYRSSFIYVKYNVWIIHDRFPFLNRTHSLILLTV